jgi:hypothetical protein
LIRNTSGSGCPRARSVPYVTARVAVTVLNALLSAGVTIGGLLP